MHVKNGRLVAVVASVALLAIVGGSVLALRQGPKDGDGATGPLSGATTSTPAPSTAPTSRPVSTPPVSTPVPTSPPESKAATPPGVSGPAKVSLPPLARLPRGRDPQLSYLTGRQLLGGAGQPVTIPGAGVIHRVARLNEVVLVLQSSSASRGHTELLKAGTGAEVEKVPDANSLVISDDATTAAYTTQRLNDQGGEAKGGAVYAELSYSGRTVKLPRPNDWHLEVLRYAGGKVYFRSRPTQEAIGWGNLYAWTPGNPTATKVSGVTSPTAVSADGSVAASMTSIADFGSCTAAVQVPSRMNLWRTCEYQIDAFSPTGVMAVGTPAYSDGYGPGLMAALDGRTGRLLREWKGKGSITFHDIRAEDDDHLLARADSGPDTKSAIIRCTVSTGRCERATELTSADVVIGN